MDVKNFLIGLGIYFLAQSAAWFQTNGQFISDWFQKNPLMVSIFVGIPTGMLYIYGTKYLVMSTPDGALWPSRILAFCCGIVVFALFTYISTGEGITLKTGICLGLATVIVSIQIFWK